jgi:hypothetical protein
MKEHPNVLIIIEYENGWHQCFAEEGVSHNMIKHGTDLQGTQTILISRLFAEPAPFHERDTPGTCHAKNGCPYSGKRIPQLAANTAGPSVPCGTRRTWARV